jgi:hypothetical protein
MRMNVATIMKRSGSMALSPQDLPEGVRMISEPIEIPSYTKEGTYARLLTAATKLRSTTPEMGLAPHLEWPCRDLSEMKKFMAALMAARRRMKKEFGRIGLMQRANPHKNEYTIYLWNQG